MSTIYNDVQALGWGEAQTIDGTSASAQSTVINTEKITHPRVKAIGDVWVNCGLDPTAQVEGTCSQLLDGEQEYITLPKNWKIAVFGGKLTITETF